MKKISLYGFYRTIFLVLLFVNCYSQPVSVSKELKKVGIHDEHEISAGQTHEYHIVLNAGEFLQIIVDQVLPFEKSGIDLTLSLYTSNGELLTEMDSPSGKEGWERFNNDERFSFIAERADTYTIKINRINLESNPVSGKYRIRILEKQNVGAFDRQTIQRERVIYQQAKRKLVELQKKEKTNAGLLQLAIPTGHTSWISSAAISPNGKIIASCSDDRTLKLWDVSTGLELYTITVDESVKSVAFSPDGRLLASATHFGDKVFLWDVASSRKIKELKGDTFSIENLSFSPDGKLLFSYHHFFRKGKIWDIASGQEVELISDGYKLREVRFISDDGKTVVSESHNGESKRDFIKVWDVNLKREITTIDILDNKFLTLSPDGKYFATFKEKDGIIKLWDTRKGRELKAINSESESGFWAKFSPNGKLLLLSGNRAIELFNVDSGQKVKFSSRFSADREKVEFSPDNKTFAVASEAAVFIFNTADGKILTVLKKHSKNVLSINYSKDGKFIISCSLDRTIKLWDVNSGKELKTYGIHTYEATLLSLSPDGKTLASAYGNNTVKLWDLNAGRGIKTLRNENFYISSIGFSPDSRAVAFSDSNRFTIKIFDAANAVELKTLKGYADDVNSVAVSPDGKFFAAGGKNKNLVLREISSYRVLKTFTGHTAEINAVAFSPDGKLLASGSADKTIKIWDIASSKLLATLSGKNDEISFIAFKPDGKSLVSIDKANAIKLWSIETQKEIGRFGKSSDSKPKSILFCLTGKQFFLEGSIHYRVTPSGANSGYDEIACSPNEKIYAAVVANELYLRDVETGQTIKRLARKNTNSENFSSSRIKSLAFFPGGKILASGFENGDITLWDVDRGEEIRTFNINRSDEEIRTFNGGRSAIQWLGFQEETQTLISMSHESFIWWNINTGEKVWEIYNYFGDVGSPVFSTDGRTIIFKNENNTIRIIDASTGFSIVDLPEANPEVIREVAAIVPDFYKNSEKEPYTSDGRFQITFGQNGRLNVYDINTSELVASIIMLDDNDWAVVDSAGRWDASEGAQKLMYYTLSTSEGYEIVDFSQLKQRFHEPDLLKKILKGEPLSLTKESLGNLKEIPLYPKIDLVESSASPRGQPCLAGSELDKQCRQFAFNLQARNGGIGKYVLRINDRDVNEFPAPRTPQPTLRQEINLEDYKRYLIPDDKKTSEIEKNKIEVIAYNAEGWLPSRGAEITYLYEEENIEPPNLWVLAVGVSDYRGEESGLQDLTYADNDAEAMAAVMQLAGEKLFPQRTTVRLLTSNAKTENEKSNKTNIKRTLTEFDKAAKSTDIMIFYMAGHGVAFGSPPNDDFYFLTNEASRSDLRDADLRETTALSGEEIIKLLTKIPANKQVLILDTCAAGKVIEQLTKSRDDATKNYRAWDRMKDRAGLWLLAGSTSDAVSYESSRFGQGVLTYSLLRGMKEDVERALRKDEEGKPELVDISTLFEYSRDEVPKLAKGIGGIQSPVVFNRYIESEKKEKTGSFDIGRITLTERAQIKLSKEKPTFVRARFVIKDNQFGEDDLELTGKMNKFLQLELSKKVDARVTFFQTDEKFPNAFVIKSNYERKDNEIKVNVKVSQYISNGNRDPDGTEQISEKEIGVLRVTGKMETIPDLMEEILKETIKIINNK